MQRYVSRELVHLVGKGSLEDRNAQFELLSTILGEGVLMNPTFGTDKDGALRFRYEADLSKDEVYSYPYVSFCDIPLADLAIHTRKYGTFGISFNRDFLLARGARPVFYIAKNAPAMQKGDEANSDFDMDYLLRYVMSDLKREHEKVKNGPTSREEETEQFIMNLNWAIMRFIKVYDASLSVDDPNNYYMEREWRLPGHLRFELGDIHRLFLMKEYANTFRERFPLYSGQLVFLDEDGVIT